MRKTLLLSFFYVHSFIVHAQTIKDVDGNLYTIDTIGTQIWMVQNLATTKYNDGKDIPIETNTTVWNGLTTDAYCWYNNDASTYKATYGALYNWYTVNTAKLCPTSWHVPSNSEWTTLTNYLGGVSVAGGKLKENGTEHWKSPNTGANNSSGFDALPGGGIFKNETYLDNGNYGFWWSSTEGSTSKAWYRYMYFGDGGIHAYSDYKSDAFSVRCISNDVVLSVSNTESNDIRLYPNPSNENLYIKNSSVINVVVEIYNPQGELMLSNQHVSSAIDISTLKKGMYIVKISTPGKIKICKFMKN